MSGEITFIAYFTTLALMVRSVPASRTMNALFVLQYLAYTCEDLIKSWFETRGMAAHPELRFLSKGSMSGSLLANLPWKGGISSVGSRNNPVSINFRKIKWVGRRHSINRNRHKIFTFCIDRSPCPSACNR